MTTKCPICKSREKEMLSKLCDNMKIMGPNFPDSTTSTVCCKKCGTVFVETEATQENFNEYYEKYAKCISYYDAFGKEKADSYYGHIFDTIKKYITPESKILDAGCGYGDFVKFLNKKGYKNVLGIDISDSCIKKAKEKRLNVEYRNILDENKDFENKFDFVVFSHTAEHILDFNKSMEKAKSYLKNGGRIYAEFPDSKKYLDVDFVPYFFYTYEHTLHFSEKTFENISRAFNLELIDKKGYLKLESYYVMYGVYEKNENTPKNTPEFTDETRNAVEEYGKICARKLRPVIEKFEKSGEELILWGIGASTAQLLNDNFDNCNIIQLIDSNPARQGVKFNIGGKIFATEAPEKLKNKTATIVILPVMYANSIQKQIKNSGIENKTATLKN